MEEKSNFLQIIGNYDMMSLLHRVVTGCFEGCRRFGKRSLKNELFCERGKG